MWFVTNVDILMRCPDDMPCFFGLFGYSDDQGSSAFFSCALTVNVIGLLFGLIFLRQCFIKLSPSTETLINGTSPKLLICLIVSQYVYWRMLLWLEASVGGLSWWWWCDVKMVEMWYWRMREIEFVLPWSIVTTHVVCDWRWYSYELCLWNLLMRFRSG